MPKSYFQTSDVQKQPKNAQATGSGSAATRGGSCAARAATSTSVWAICHAFLSAELYPHAPPRAPCRVPCALLCDGTQRMLMGARHSGAVPEIGAIGRSMSSCSGIRYSGSFRRSTSPAGTGIRSTTARPWTSLSKAVLPSRVRRRAVVTGESLPPLVAAPSLSFPPSITLVLSPLLDVPFPWRSPPYSAPLLPGIKRKRNNLKPVKEGASATALRCFTRRTIF